MFEVCTAEQSCAGCWLLLQVCMINCSHPTATIMCSMLFVCYRFVYVVCEASTEHWQVCSAKRDEDRQCSLPAIMAASSTDPGSF
jgi:hypothetical protein